MSWEPGELKGRNPEKIGKYQILRMEIHSAQNVGRVLISEKNRLRSWFGAIFDIFFQGYFFHKKKNKFSQSAKTHLNACQHIRKQPKASEGSEQVRTQVRASPRTWRNLRKPGSISKLPKKREAVFAIKFGIHQPRGVWCVRLVSPPLSFPSLLSPKILNHIQFPRA